MASVSMVPESRRDVSLPWIQLLSQEIFQKAANHIAGGFLHVRCHMGVGVQREGGIGVAQDAGEGLGIHADGQSNRLRFPINNKKSEYPEGYSNHPRIMKRPVKAGNTGGL